MKEIDLYVLPRIWFRLLVLVFICKATVRDAMIDSSGSGAQDIGLPDPVSPPQMRLFTNTKIYKYKYTGGWCLPAAFSPIRAHRRQNTSTKIQELALPSATCSFTNPCSGEAWEDLASLPFL